MIKIAIRNITMAGYLCKRFGLSGVSGEMMSLPFSVFVLIGDLGVCKIVAKIFFFVIVFYLFTLFTFLTGLTMNFMDYITRGKPKGKNGLADKNKDLFARNEQSCCPLPSAPPPALPVPFRRLSRLAFSPHGPPTTIAGPRLIRPAPCYLAA